MVHEKYLQPEILVLRRAWLRSGESIASIADRAAYSAARVSEVLSGRKEPSMSAFIAIANALGFDVTVTPREDQS